MAISNRERIDKCFEQLREGLTPFAEQRFKAHFGKIWIQQIKETLKDSFKLDKSGNIIWDTQALLKAIGDSWQEVFRDTLGYNERAWVSELRTIRNNWAHENPFSTDETYRALDTIQLLLSSVSAPKQATEVGKYKQELLRNKYEEQVRYQTTKSLQIESEPQSGLKSWREIITPHPDVSSGKYIQAEFAADLSQVHREEAMMEYQDPREFFRRTYLTEGLKNLLTNALKRITGQGGDPVIELQTSFGGGKTHSMLALYHLFSQNTKTADLLGVDNLLKDSGVTSIPTTIKRVVLVGQSLSPGQPETKKDGTVVRTLWGELAWQLGGKDAYSKIADSDKNGTSPGSKLIVDLLKQYSPCLILIDEWVTYVRQTYNTRDLPAGSFDANMTFAQALTEAVKASKSTLLVASLPSSDIETGGEGGKEALNRLKHTFGRVQTPWRPANPEESFEIIRRRLFEPLPEKNYVQRDAVIKAFIDMYSGSKDNFPKGCSEKDYRNRMEAAYPIHPELFDRLYSDWSTLEKFQLTRGVLRLMAATIHDLWAKGDKSYLIMPSRVSVDAPNVQSELMHYLPDGWRAVIDKDVDGPKSIPFSIDRSQPNLGRYSSCRRVARTIFMGSAPTSASQNPGIDEKNIILGCAQPGESISTFGDALRRLNDQATYIYVDGKRYWYSTMASITSLAQGRAEQYKIDDVWEEMGKRLEKERKEKSSFSGIHIFQSINDEVTDEKEVRLVILGPAYTHIKNSKDTEALKYASQILNNRGNSPRIFRNMLVFLAPDKSKLAELEQSVRWFLAWDSIIREKDNLDLKPTQERQAEARRTNYQQEIEMKLSETWCWCINPMQSNPTGPIEYEEIKITGQNGLAGKVSKKLISDEHLLDVYSAPRLKLELDKHNLWKDKNHVEVKLLLDYFATYPYLPRIKNIDVFYEAIKDGFTKVFCENFGYASAYDESKGRYLGLIAKIGMPFSIELSGLLVKSEIAKAQFEKEEQTTEPSPTGTSPVPTPDGRTGKPIGTTTKVLKRFHASVKINPNRIIKDTGKVVEEIIQHLSDVKGANMNITLEIHGEFEEGIPEKTARTVTENCNTLKFESHGFEEE